MTQDSIVLKELLTLKKGKGRAEKEYKEKKSILYFLF